MVIGEIATALRCSLEALDGDAGAGAERQALDDIRSGLARLSEIDVHYLRKENQLFPMLEAHGIVGPTKVMWSLDDDIRARIKADRSHAERGDTSTPGRSLPETLTMVEDMVYKEEKILFPTALDSLTAEEWAQIAAGDAEIGYAWVEGPSGERAREAATSFEPEGGELLLPLTTGVLTPEQIDLMLRALPFDVTYVDADDRVRYYSEGERVFPRSPAAIGREVRNCHPPKSLHKVEQILAEFKAGTKDTAEFWIELGPRFVHIRYFAIRDALGVYQGCLEVVQDATHVRQLTGSGGSWTGRRPTRRGGQGRGGAREVPDYTRSMTARFASTIGHALDRTVQLGGTQLADLPLAAAEESADVGFADPPRAERSRDPFGEREHRVDAAWREDSCELGLERAPGRRRPTRGRSRRPLPRRTRR